MLSCHAGATNPDGVTPRHYGWWMGDDATILGANTVWILVIFGWTMGMMLPFFYGLKLCGWLRVSAEEELVRGPCQLLTCSLWCLWTRHVSESPASCLLAVCGACGGRSDVRGLPAVACSLWLDAGHSAAPVVWLKAGPRPLDIWAL